MNKRFKQELGRFGEIRACEYLVKKKYKIVERNFLCRQGEIDIIAISKLNELVFIEVKTRRSLQYGSPCEAVTPYKIRNIKQCSKYYIFLHNLYELNVRYDVIEIMVYESFYSVNHIESAF